MVVLCMHLNIWGVTTVDNDDTSTPTSASTTTPATSAASSSTAGTMPQRCMVTKHTMLLLASTWRIYKGGCLEMVAVLVRGKHDNVAHPVLVRVCVRGSLFRKLGKFYSLYLGYTSDVMTQTSTCDDSLQDINLAHVAVAWRCHTVLTHTINMWVAIWWWRVSNSSRPCDHCGNKNLVH